MDVVPVLNEELLLLGDWLSKTTLCYKISAYQAMLPPALKAKYERKLKLVSENANFMLPDGLEQLFASESSVLWEEAIKFASIHAIQKLVKEGIAEVHYEVQSKGKRKQQSILSHL